MAGNYVFDIETDGLLDTVTKIHSLVLKDVDTGEVISCTDNSSEYKSIEEGLSILREADKIIGHNILCFDLPIIDKLYDFTPKSEVYDTLVIARLLFPDMMKRDLSSISVKPPEYNIPPKLLGSHSLEAWGYRLGDYKDEFGKTSDWQNWSLEMQSYCEQDCAVTLSLFNYLRSKEPSGQSVVLEHQFQEIIFRQEQEGVLFDVKKAREFYSYLIDRLDELSTQLKEAFPPVDEGSMFTPKVNNKTKGWQKGVPIWKPKIVEFNPSSRDMIIKRLNTKYGWQPDEFTANGKPKVDDEIISKLPYEEAPLIAEYLLVQKRISQLATGNQAWLSLVDETGRIHGRVNTNGAVTGRCTHHHPNLAQVPAVGIAYGKSCRELFIAPDGYSMLGCDASGLELRCLSHYITIYDGGAYRDVILHGDIHTLNQQSAGLPTRNLAKRFIYAFLYGAGDKLLGSIIEPDADEAKQIRVGRKTRANFLKKTPALNQLITDVKTAVKKRGYLIGLDKRMLTARSEHSALNLLLQSAGAVVMKKATCLLWDELDRQGFKYGDDVVQVLHIHDEFQLYVRNGLEEQVGKIAVNAIKQAGEFFNFRCPLDGEYKVGKNWADTH